MALQDDLSKQKVKHLPSMGTNELGSSLTPCVLHHAVAAKSLLSGDDAITHVSSHLSQTRGGCDK